MPPLARVGAFWFVYMGALGIFFPFFGLYLRESAGLSGFEVGVVVSMLPLVGLAMQPLWGQLADRSGERARVLAGLVAVGGVAQLGLGIADGFPAILLATAIAAVFWTSVMPMSLSVSLAILRSEGIHAFGIARACGTVGYLVFVVAFPPLLAAAFGSAPPGKAPPGLVWMFPSVTGVALLAALLALRLPREGAVAIRARRGGLAELLRHPPMLRMLVYSFFAYFFVNGPIQLFPLFVQSLGGGIDDLSRMWIWMVALEVPLLVFSGRLLARLGSRSLLLFGAIAAGLRWSGSSFADDLAVATALGLLHGAVVTGLGIGASLYVEEAVPEPLRSTGQALLATVGIGAGGIASNLVAGWLFDHVGSRATYLACGIGALALGALTFAILPTPARPERTA